MGRDAQRLLEAAAGFMPGKSPIVGYKQTMDEE